MRYVIIEDEPPAVAQLQRDMEVLVPGAQLISSYATVRAAVAGLASAEALDLIFCDIQLADGSSLEIFGRVQIRCPVIFCTAYDEYIMPALSTHGVDYLLKPIERDRLARALEKVRTLEAHYRERIGAACTHRSAPQPKDSSPRGQRLLAKRGAEWVALDYESIVYFTTEHKLTIAFDRDGQAYLIDGSLADLELRLDPRRFFRANRRYLVHVNAVQSFRLLGKGRLSITVMHAPTPVQVSQENSRRFRLWLEG